jgi:endonuclease III
MDSVDLQNQLIKRAKAAWSRPVKLDRFAAKPEADQLVKDIRSHPHAYVIACLMDRRITAERAWGIPYELQQRLGSFEFSFLRALSLQQLEEAMQRPTALHALGQAMPVVLYRAIHHIDEAYDGDASAIWKGRPSSETIVRRFREFYGAGPKISTMAANILVRDFRVDVADRSAIDISVDVHIRRIFARMGFVLPGASDEMIIVRAREMNPEYPGILDLLLWDLGRERCRPTNPGCHGCNWKDRCAYAIADRPPEPEGQPKEKKTLVIVACGKSKVWDRQADAGPQRARDAYTGAYFSANRKYAEGLGCAWIILSAKYGFMQPDFVIPRAYDVTFKDASSHPVSIEELRDQVRKQGLERYDRVTVLGGREYVRRVEDAFSGTNTSIDAPFAGTRMGSQMSAMKGSLHPAGSGVHGESVETRPPNTKDFDRALNQLLSSSTGGFVDVTAGELHRLVCRPAGGCNRMPTCCDVMRKTMRTGDIILSEPPKGRGSRLKIRYLLPR